MSKFRPNRNKQKPGGRYAALALLAVIILAVGGYMVFSRRTEIAKKTSPLPPVAQKSTMQALPHNQSLGKSVSPPSKDSLTEEKAYTESTHPPARLPDEQLPGTGQMAVIIDDMGGSMQEARSLAAIGVPVTFSIIPGLHRYREVASFAASNGIETMIHIPMQSKEWPQRRLESNGLLVSMEKFAITELMDEFIQDIPKAVGANNHMGSEFTEHEEQMRVVLQALKNRGLFFVDSVTSPQTMGPHLAREIGVKSGRRNVFLDNEQDRAYIQGQLRQAVRIAKKNGSSIVICHPHPATIKALAALLPGLETQGITLVSASRLVR